MAYKYAIDFGTTNSSIAIRETDRISGGLRSTVLPIFSENGTVHQDSMPSLIYIDEKGGIEVGRDAKAKLKDSGKRTDRCLIRQVKMAIDKIGVNCTTDTEDYGAYCILNHQDADKIMVKLKKSGKTFSLLTLVSILLKRLKENADKAFYERDCSASGVVMGVPVGLSDPAKEFLLSALVEAGFYSDKATAKAQTQFVSEPVAVAVNYGTKLEENRNVMVFDFGGGTLDIAIMTLSKHGRDGDPILPHKVRAKDRLTLGGEQINRMLFERMILPKIGSNKFKKAFGLREDLSDREIWPELSKNYVGLQFQDYVEEIKERLSTEPMDKPVNFEHQNALEGIHIVLEGDDRPQRRAFETLVLDSPWLATPENTTEMLSPCEAIRRLVLHCLDEAGLDSFDIDDVLLAGGSSLTPRIQSVLIEDLNFGKHKVHGCTSPSTYNPTPPSDVLYSIVKGLAVYARTDSAKKRIEDIVDSDYGVWDGKKGKVSIILKKGTPYSMMEYDRISAVGGCSKEYEVVDMSTQQVDVQVYETTLSSDIKLGTITIQNPGGGKYRIFFKCDADTGILTVDIFDRVNYRWYDDIPLSDRQFHIGH